MILKKIFGTRPEHIVIYAFVVVAGMQLFPLFMSFGVAATIKTIYLSLLAQAFVLPLLLFGIMRAKKLNYIDLSNRGTHTYLVALAVVLLLILFLGVFSRNVRANLMRDAWLLLFYLILLRFALFPLVWAQLYRIGVIAFWAYLPFVLIGLTRTGTSAFTEGFGPGAALVSDSRFIQTAGYEMRGLLYIWPVLFAYSVLSAEPRSHIRWLGLLTPVPVLILLVYVFAFRSQLVLISLQVVSVLCVGIITGSGRAVARLLILAIAGAITFFVWLDPERLYVLTDRFTDRSSWEYRLAELNALLGSGNRFLHAIVGRGLGGTYPFYSYSGGMDVFIQRPEIHLGIFWPYLKGGIVLVSLMFLPIFYALTSSIKWVWRDGRVACAYAVIPVYFATWAVNPFPTFDNFFPFIPVAMLVAALLGRKADVVGLGRRQPR